MAKAKAVTVSNTDATEVIGYIDALVKLQAQLTAHNERGNRALYKLLGEIKKVCEYLDACDDSASVIKKLRKMLKEERSIKTQANSSIKSIIIKCLVPTSRKTQCVYASVINAAYANGIAGDKLAEYIRANNGIENVRKLNAKAKTEAATSVAADIANVSQKLLNIMRDSGAKQRLGVVKIEGVISFRMLHDRCELTHLMCRENKATGELEIVAVAYPTLQLQKLALDNYVTRLQLAAMQHTNEFYGECKRLNASMDTVNTWREANGLQSATQAIALLAGLGVTLDADTVRRANEAEAAASKRLAIAYDARIVDVPYSKQSASQPNYVIAA